MLFLVSKNVFPINYRKQHLNRNHNSRSLSSVKYLHSSWTIHSSYILYTLDHFPYTHHTHTTLVCVNFPLRQCACGKREWAWLAVSLCSICWSLSLALPCDTTRCIARPLLCLGMFCKSFMIYRSAFDGF